jgi:lysozyme
MANLSAQNSTINFLMDVEGFQAKAYWDFKQWSIGYGSGIMPNGKPVKQGDVVTKDQARAMLARDVVSRANAVNRYVTANINQNQFDALVSFTYNLGATTLADSTLLDVINQNPSNYDAIAAQFRRWINAGGIPNQGLINRREKEIKLYTSGMVTTSVFFWLILVVILTLIIRKRRK